MKQIGSFFIKHNYYFKLIISFILIVIVFFKIDLSQFITQISKINIFTLIIVPIITLLQFLVNIYIKRTAFSIYNFNVTNKQMFKQMFKGSFYGFFMPSFIAGDAYHSIYFGKKFNNYSKIITALFLNKLIGISIFFTIGLFTILIWENNDQIRFIDFNYSYILLIILLILTIFLILYFIYKNYLQNIFQKFKTKTSEIIFEYKNNTSKLFKIIILSFLYYIVSIGGRVGIILSINSSLHIGDIFFSVVLVNFILLIPVTISGIGVREGSYIYILQLFGISKAQALVIAFLDFSITVFAILIGGVLIVHNSIFQSNKK